MADGSIAAAPDALGNPEAGLASDGEAGRAPGSQAASAPESPAAPAPERQVASAPESRAAPAPESQAASAPDDRSGPVRDGVAYSAEYYRMSRPEAGAKGLVDRVRDWHIHRLIVRRVPGGRLLDVGCGLGLFLQRMAGEFELYGMDLSEYAVAAASQRLPQAHLAVGSLTDGSLADDGRFDGTFDVVTAINIFEHLDDPAAGLDAVRARLRAGGLLVAHLPTIGNTIQARMYAGSYDRDPTHLYRPSGAEFCRLAERHGFVTSTYSYAPFVGAPLWRRLPWHPAFLAVYRAV